MDYLKPKLTQGQVKTRRRLKELFENEAFRNELSQILKVPNKRKQNKLLHNFAEYYFLEFEPGSPLFDLIMGSKLRFDEQIGHELDVCDLYDEVDEYLNPQFRLDFDLPPSRNPRKRAQINAFPIHVGISTKATKRDVLDFINKRWDYIRDMLNYYEENPKGTRIKRKQKRDEYIWKHRLLPKKEIAELTNTKFPNEVLTYSDVNSILRYLRKRKTEL